MTEVSDFFTAPGEEEAVDKGHGKKSDGVKNKELGSPSSHAQALEAVTSEEAAPKGKSDIQKTWGRKADAMTSEGTGPIVPSLKKAKQETAQRAEGSIAIQQKNQSDETSASSATTGVDGSGRSLAAASRPCFPPYPSSGISDRMAVRKWVKECTEVRKFYQKNPDPRQDLPTWRKPKDPETTGVVRSLKDKVAIMSESHIIVSVSVMLDGQVRPPCSGIIIEQSNSSIIIVTCARAISSDGKIPHPLPKICVSFVDEQIGVLDADLALLSDHYGIALLRLSLPTPLKIPSFGQGPEYGQEVFVLGRDNELSLGVRRGKIKWLEESGYLMRDYYMFLDCDIPEGGSGGMVIDHNGKVRGLSFHCSPYHAVLSISTVETCVKMFVKFGRIPRPILGFGVRTLALLDVELHDELWALGIKSGFFVEMVYGSDAKELGIKRADVLTSIGGQDNLTLPELEDFLLAFGWECLNDKISVKHLKLVVRDLKSGETRNIDFPARFCDAAERGWAYGIRTDGL